MARARGLGPQGGAAIDRYRNLPDATPGLPNADPDRTDEYELAETRVGSRALFGTGPDFGPYVLSRASEYYRGPKSSTRVSGHQFIPLDENAVQKVVEGQMGSQFYWNLRGYIYVRFWKTGKRGDLWRYGPCTLQDYRTFRESSSKGRSVRALEVFGHGATTPDVAGPTLGI